MVKSFCLGRKRVSAGVMKNVLEVDSGGGCTTL